MRHLFYLLITVLSTAYGQDEVRVLEDSTVEVPPGQIYFRIKDGTPVTVGVVTATDVSTAGSVTIIEKLYTDICTTPCAVEMPAGWHELRFAYDDVEWVRKVEVKSGPQTYTTRKYDPRKFATGMILTSVVVGAPVGLPMVIAASPRPKWAAGPPVQ